MGSQTMICMHQHLSLIILDGLCPIKPINCVNERYPQNSCYAANNKKILVDNEKKLIEPKCNAFLHFHELLAKCSVFNSYK